MVVEKKIKINIYKLWNSFISVCVSSAWIMTDPLTATASSCEICSVIRFLQAEEKSAADIHRHLCSMEIVLWETGSGIGLGNSMMGIQSDGEGKGQ